MILGLLLAVVVNFGNRRYEAFFVNYLNDMVLPALRCGQRSQSAFLPYLPALISTLCLFLASSLARFGFRLLASLLTFLFSLLSNRGAADDSWPVLLARLAVDRAQGGELMIGEIGRRWRNHKDVMVKWMKKFFLYLDTYYTKREGKPGVYDTAMLAF